MEIRKNINNILFILFSALFLLSNPQIILPQILEEKREEIRNEALSRSVMIHSSSSSWSGVVLEKNYSNTLILTIIHEGSAKKTNSSNPIIVSFQNGDEYVSKVNFWDECQEVALLSISNAGGTSNIKRLSLDLDKPKISKKLFSFGNPLGMNTHYTEGFLSSKDNVLKDCGMLTNGYSGGVIPGQTGSGVWNERGELAGLIVATSAFQTKVYGPSDSIIGVGSMPVTFLGRFVPASTIKKLLTNKHPI